MFNVTSEHDNILTIDVSGKVDADEMSQGLAALMQAAEGIEHGGMLMRLADIEMPTLGAIRVEMAQFGRLIGLIRRFDKIALLANQGWVQQVAMAEVALIPGLSIRTFEPGEQAEAIAYLTVDPDLDVPG